MKQKIQILFIVTAPLWMGGCNDMLNLQPKNMLTITNSFDTEQNANTVTASIEFYINGFFNNNPYLQIGLIADEAQGAQGLREWQPNGVIMAPGAQTWRELYDIVFLANMMIDNLHRIKEDISEERKAFHLGQAFFAKGLAYFAIASRYGDCIITKDSKTTTPYPLSPAIDALNEAENNVKKALEILPVHDDLRDIRGAAIRSKQYASKGNAAALLAQVNAWKGSVIDLYGYKGDAKQAYAEAVKYCSEIIDGKVGNYALYASHEEQCQIMSDPSKQNPEAIFDLTFDLHRSQYAQSDCPARYFMSWPVDKTQTLGDIASRPNFRIYKSTINKLYPDKNDKRRKTYFYQIDTPHIVGGKDYAILYKWRNSIYIEDKQSPLGYYFRSINADYNYWRLTDIYLLRAECNVKLGNDGIAIADLNKIRQRAGTAAYPSVEDGDLKHAIFTERQRELFAEGHRYADIVRNNYIKEELNGKFKTLTLAEIKDGALYLPIPKSTYKTDEGMILNGLISQNPYWSKYF